MLVTKLKGTDQGVHIWKTMKGIQRNWL